MGPWGLIHCNIHNFVKDLPEDLEWKIIYVGSAESEEYDQVKNWVLENITYLQHVSDKTLW